NDKSNNGVGEYDGGIVEGANRNRGGSCRDNNRPRHEELFRRRHLSSLFRKQLLQGRRDLQEPQIPPESRFQESFVRRDPRHEIRFLFH
ncbi:hypothetical protein U1Q18_014664, partial [Sarracenia purpurea var. burkii]